MDSIFLFEVHVSAFFRFTVFSGLWKLLTEPAEEIRDPIDRRNARFILSWMTIGLPVSIGTVLVLPWIDEAVQGLSIWHALFLLIGLLIYLLARTRHYYLACVLEVAILWVGTTVTTVALPSQGHSLGFLIVPVLLAAAVLSQRFLFVFATLSLLTVPAVLPLLPQPDLHGLFHSGLLLLAGSAFIITARIHRERQMETSARSLREREARYRNLLEAAYDGTAIVESESIVEASLGFARLFGPDLLT